MITLAKDTLTKADVQDKLKEIFAQHKGEKHELITVLQETQEKFRYLPAAAMKEISQYLNVPEATIYGVATFYAQFRLRPVGRNVIKVCHGTACHVANAEGISRTLEDQLRIGEGETTPDREFTLETVACLGCCSLAPVIMINKDTHGNLKPTDLRSVLKPYRERKAG